MHDRDVIVSSYREYLDACNRRDWAGIESHLAETIIVNGRPRTRDQYVTDIRATIETFPDYEWSLVRAVVEGEWLAVHLHDVGTRRMPFLGAPGDGSHVKTEEFDMYRIVDGRIHEVEGTADNARLRQ
jgi:predicted ester cyclase